MTKKVVRAIILDKDNKVLLGKRANGFQAGKWALIGGKLDKGENEKIALIREVCEEIGVDLENIVLWQKRLHQAKGKEDHLKETYFIATISNKIEELIVDLKENSEVKYFAYNELQNFDIVPIHKNVLEEFFNRKG